MAIGFKSHTRFLWPKSFLITKGNCALLNIYSPFNSPRGCIACLRDWEPNAIIKQLVKSTCLCQCERCLNYADGAICISPVRCYELELNSRVFPALQTGWPEEQNKSGWRLLHMLTFIMLHSPAVMCLDACVWRTTGAGIEGEGKLSLSCKISTTLISLIESTAEDIWTVILHKESNGAHSLCYMSV